MTKNNKIRVEIKLYIIITAFIALAMGVSDGIMANYFKETYQVNAFQRGVIEFPRELPGLLCMVAIAIGARWGDLRMAIVAQLLTFFGILVLGIITPEFQVMLIYLFVFSLGMHLYMPLQDSIGISLVEDKNKIGRRMGQYNGVKTAMRMIAGIVIFVGFKYGWFSFLTPRKIPFIISAFLLLIAAFLFVILEKRVGPKPNSKKIKFLIRKEYKFYYILTLASGAQKQIMLVFGPWVLIELLGQPVETLAILGIIGAFVGIFFLPAIGRWIDHFGIKKMLMADAVSFIGVYLIYGILTTFVVIGGRNLSLFLIIGVYLLFIIDNMSMQMAMIRVVYLKSIILAEEEMTSTLSTGISIDHAISIISAFLGGIIWVSFGPQYVFFAAAVLSLTNLAVAILVGKKG